MATWNVLVEALNRLNDQRGAQERVSLKLLVEELCNLYDVKRKSQRPAHGVKGDEYTACAETKSGRFVTAAVEAMVPDNLGSTGIANMQTWFVPRLSCLTSRVCDASGLEPVKSL